MSTIDFEVKGNPLQFFIRRSGQMYLRIPQKKMELPVTLYQNKEGYRLQVRFNVPKYGRKRVYVEHEVGEKIKNVILRWGID